MAVQSTPENYCIVDKLKGRVPLRRADARCDICTNSRIAPAARRIIDESFPQPAGKNLTRKDTDFCPLPQS